MKILKAKNVEINETKDVQSILINGDLAVSFSKDFKYPTYISDNIALTVTNGNIFKAKDKSGNFIKFTIV